MIKRILAAVIGMVFIISVTGCEKKESAADTVQKEKKLEEFHVVLDWYPNGVHAFLYEAIEKGYYEEEGLQVNIQFPSNINDAVSLTAAGKGDIGIYYLQDVILARANQSVPIKAVGTVVQSPLNIVLSLKDKNITSAKDLEGKTIGYAGTELSEALIETILEDAGSSIENVTMVDVGFDLLSAMTTGNVDATIGCMANHEVPALIEEGFEVNYFYLNEYGVPNYYELVFVTGEKQTKEQKEKLEGFLRASKKGFDDMKNNPQEALALLLKNQNEENFPLIESVEKQSIDMLIPLMETEEEPFLYQNKEIWQNNIDWLKQKGLIKRDITPDDIVMNLLK